MKTTNTSIKNRKIIITIIPLSILFIAIVLINTRNAEAHHKFFVNFVLFLFIMLCLRFIFHEEKSDPFSLRKKRRLVKLRKLQKKYKESILRKKNYLANKQKSLKPLSNGVLNDLKFPDADVLTDREEINRREKILYNAMRAGNEFKHKVKLYFKDKEKEREAEGTIWYANQEHVALKGGIILPVKRIYKIEF